MLDKHKSRRTYSEMKYLRFKGKIKKSRITLEKLQNWLEKEI